MEFNKVTQYINDADGILICTGAGMGVDSGIGTFRGKNAGIWPPLKDMNMDFQDMSQPKWFKSDPRLAWAFWKYRWENYTSAEPHEGYHIIKRWIENKGGNGFSFTSNIDGHWSNGVLEYNKVIEIHGTLNYLQCTKPCVNKIWKTPDLSYMTIDKSGKRISKECELPKCRYCGGIARPAVLMFDDDAWVYEEFEYQRNNYNDWLDQVNNICIIEIGAGKAIPTVRNESQDVASMSSKSNSLIRINLEQSKVSKHIKRSVSIESGGLEALKEIDQLLKNK